MVKFGSNAPPEELKCNWMFLALQDMLGSTLDVTRKLPGGEDALIRL